MKVFSVDFRSAIERPFAERKATLIGKPGEPAIGPYDPRHLNNPSGIAVDSQGRVWVAEADYYPLRVIPVFLSDDADRFIAEVTAVTDTSSWPVVVSHPLTTCSMHFCSVASGCRQEGLLRATLASLIRMSVREQIAASEKQIRTRFCLRLLAAHDQPECG